MRKIITLLLLAAPLAAFSGDKNTLSGNWREIKRMGSDNGVISFRDTILLKFMVGNEYIWQKAGGMIYKGTYKIENNALDLGMRYFTIMEKKPNRLVLKDEAGIYEFTTYKEVAVANAPKAEEHFAPVNSIQQMVGHWSVYKGTSAKTNQSIDYSRQLKVVDIYSTPQDGGKLGALFARKDADNAPSWYVESFSNQTLVCNGRDRRVFKVIKCQDNELIMQEDDYTYFFRQFK